MLWFGYADTRMKFQDEAPLTHIHFQYTEMVNWLISTNYSAGWSTYDVEGMRSPILHFKKSMWCLFGPNCKPGRNTFNFHLLDYRVSDLDRFKKIIKLCEAGGGPTEGGLCFQMHAIGAIFWRNSHSPPHLLCQGV